MNGIPDVKVYLKKRKHAVFPDSHNGSFRTADAADYPPKLADAIAGKMDHALTRRRFLSLSDLSSGHVGARALLWDGKAD